MSVGDIKFTPDLSKATVGVSDLQQQLADAQAAAQKQASAIADAARIQGAKWPTYLAYGLGGLIGLAIVLFIVDFIYVKTTGNELTGFGWITSFMPAEPTPAPSTPQGTGTLANTFIITGAYYGLDTTTNFKDVTAALNALRVNQNTGLKGFLVAYNNLGFGTDPFPAGPKTLWLNYTAGVTPVQASYPDGTNVPDLPIPSSTPGPVSATGPPNLFSRIYSAIFSGSTPNLAPALHDATNSVSVPGKNAPLSAGPEGGYSMQWWMFIKDWNYGYGKPKSVIRRPDATSGAIANPDISLHPTDNALQVSVSIYPSTGGGAAKATPAPAGHSGSTDDVFVCQVPNIPLQTWFAVSLSVFGRNLDIYIDGKLVKSCFLTGVPKPAVGDIQLTPGGGFSGSVCNFYHYSRMLNPADAIAFWSAGTPCQNQTLPDGNTANKYSVNFGMYDATGKKIQNYTF